jgi:glycosyltransferase involved in cell wall biosynthesis
VLVNRRSNTSGTHRVLIIVQNLPVPFDRRVWLECRALIDAGYRVAVICPRGPGDPPYEVLEGVELYKYSLRSATNGALAFFGEYARSFVMTALLTVRARRHGRLDAIQTCNPPDIFWPVGLAWRGLSGTRFVFDQHDLCPELYDSRFPQGSRLFARALKALELRTYRAADHVIVTNESYARVARRRGKVNDRDITVVRTGPNAERLQRGRPDPSLRRGRRFLGAYIGVMGPQDGVDYLLRAVHHVVHEMNRLDVSFVLMGSGDCFDDLVALRDELDLADFVTFTGRVPDDVVTSVLSTADIGLSPDPKNPLNDVSTMNKTLEYMAYQLPVVAFDLHETRVSAADAAIYATPNRIDSYAQAIVELLDDAPRRLAMGAAGRERVERELSWDHQRPQYVSVYDRLLGVDRSTPVPLPLSATGT